MLKKKMAKSLSIFIVVLMSFSIIACTSAFQTTKKVEKVTLRIGSVYTPEHPFGPAIAQIIEKFMKDNPGVTVEKEFAAGTEYQNSIKASLASDNLPEVFVVYPSATNKDLVDAKKIVDLAPYIKADKKWSNGFLAGAFDNFNYNGGIYAAPIGTYCVGFFYNKDLFQKANVQPPKSWNQLITVIKKLKTSGVTPWALGNKDTWRSEHLFTNIFEKLYGPKVNKAIGNHTIPYNSPQMIATFAAMAQLRTVGAFDKSFDGLDYAAEIAAFNNQKAAMRMSGSWTVGETTGKDAPKDIKSKVGFFAFPYFEGSAANKDNWMGGVSDSFAVSSKSTGYKLEMAIKLVKALTSTESSKLIQETAHDLTAIKADIDPVKSGTLIAEVSKAMATGKTFSPDFAAAEAIQAVNTKLYNMTQAVLGKNITPKAAAKQLQDEYNRNK